MNQHQWLQKLYNENAPALYRLAVNRLRSGVGHTEDAEDVLQDVFLLAMQRDLSDHPAPVGWLVKATVIICRNYVKRNNHHREKQRRYAQSKLDVSADRSLFFVSSQEPETNEREIMIQMEQCMTAEEWELLRAYSLEGVPVEELAQRTGMTVNALRVRIHRLRNKARKICQDE